MKVYQALAE